MLLLGGAILLWGANWPVMKLGLGHVSPLWFSALRFATGAACLFAWQAARGRVRRPRAADLPVIASIGLLQMMLFTALGAVAMTHLPAGRSAILSYTTPIWVVPVAVLVFGERIARRQWAGIGLAALGVAILFNPHAIDWRDGTVLGAHAMLLAASVAWAACILHLRYGGSEASAAQLAPWQMLLAVANRPADNNTTYTTGGDVSRFQRRSIPAQTPSAPAAASAAGSSTPAAGIPAGPVVRVARGNSVTVVPVGAR